jgi:hypothetical protein
LVKEQKRSTFVRPLFAFSGDVPKGSSRERTDSQNGEGFVQVKVVLHWRIYEKGDVP